MSARPDSPLVVLLVDGNRTDDRAAALEREHPRFQVYTEPDIATGLDTLDEQSIDCVVSSYPLSEDRGADILTAVRNRDPDLPILLLTDGDIDASDAFAAGITDYVPRTADPVVLATRIANAVARYRAEQELAAARERYDLVSRASADAFLEWDLDTDTVRRCDGIVDTFGYEPGEIEPSFDWWVERVHPDDRDRVVTDLSRGAAGDLDAYEDVYRFRNGDGSYAYVLARGYTTEADDRRRMFGVLTDITEQIEYLSRFRELIEHSSDAISIVDTEWTITYISPSVEQVIGVDPASVVGTNALDRVHPADRERVVDAFRPLLDAPGRESGPIAYRIERADGEWAWVESVAKTPRDHTLVDGILVNTRNVTERKARKERLRKLEQAIDQTGAAVYMTDVDGVIEYVNPAFEELTGYASEEAVGETPTILNSGEQDEAYYQHLWETVERGDVWEETIVDQRRSGEKYTAVQTIGPIVDDDGSIVGYVAIQNDITDDLLDEQRVRVLNRMLRHNLRNGLNVVQGHVEYVAEHIHDEELQDALRTVTDRCERLLAESEKARQFQMLLNAERYSPRPVREIIANLRTQTDGLADSNVTITVGPDIDGAVLNVVEHALVELVENAVQHTDGEVTVTVECRLVDDAEFEFVVADDGPGLPAMERRVLETGAETPLEHSQGLGLWLTHWLVQIAGGSVTFADNDPSGTVISVRVPRL